MNYKLDLIPLIKKINIIGPLIEFVKSISNSNELIEDICNFDFIFGCESMALVISLIAKKKVISCIPIKTKKSSLPFRILFI